MSAEQLGPSSTASVIRQVVPKAQFFEDVPAFVKESGKDVDELLGEVADFYNTEVEYDIRRLSEAIEPILIVFIAGLVLILALGVFLPIWDLNTAVQGS